MSNTLYKFQDWANRYHRLSFLEAKIYFSNNFSFNDPFDLQLPIITEGEMKYDEDLFIEDFQSIYSRVPTAEELELAKSNWHNITEDSPEVKRDGESEFRKISSEIEDELGILCLSKRNNSTLMWGHYASSHSGFCIGLNKKKLNDFLKLKLSSKFQFLDVEYVENIPKLNYELIFDDDYLNEASNKRFATKHIDWKYESELRIIVSKYKKQLLKIPSDIYDELIFGYKMDNTEIMEMKIIAEKLYPSIKLFKAEPHKHQFGMNIIPL